MTPSSKYHIVRQLLLTLWAMATLVLCFVLVLLINEMLKKGENPLSALSPETEEWPENASAEDWKLGALGTREITLFFAGEDGHWLAPENMALEYGGRTVENCRNALQGILAGPKNEMLLPLLSAQTRIRALYLRDNELTIDLSSEMIASPNHPKSAEMEALMVYGIVNTMTQQSLQGEDGFSVQTVRFLFDGSPPQETFPAHLDLSDPLAQDKRWTRTGLK
ncbi:MAG TPA: hypothetical protein ENN29_06365 [Candidatus Hydrogenedentes bacterium]|nr:hypothetical protein [Candidatus Hydrogenedentota bacterium]